MIKLTAIDHVVFRVQDMDRMIGFYRDVLGAEIEREVPDFGLVQMRAGNSLIDLLAIKNSDRRSGINVDHVCFRVVPWDEAAILSHLANHGLPDLEVASRYGAEGQGPSIYLHDPEGNMLELKGPSEV